MLWWGWLGLVRLGQVRLGLFDKFKGTCMVGKPGLVRLALQ